SRVAIPAGRFARPCFLSIIHGIEPSVSGLPGTRDVAVSPPVDTTNLVLPSSRLGYPWRATRCIVPKTTPLECVSRFVPTLYGRDHNGRQGRVKQGKCTRRSDNIVRANQLLGMSHFP